jgi:hypothetical protein
MSVELNSCAWLGYGVASDPEGGFDLVVAADTIYNEPVTLQFVAALAALCAGGGAVAPTPAIVCLELRTQEIHLIFIEALLSAGRGTAVVTVRGDPCHIHIFIWMGRMSSAFGRQGQAIALNTVQASQLSISLLDRRISSDIRISLSMGVVRGIGVATAGERAGARDDDEKGGGIPG